MSNVITIAKNRLFTLYIYAYNGENVLTLGEGEKLIFGVKRRTTDTSYVIKKELTSANMAPTNDKYLVSLSAAETDLQTGDYYYDVAYKNANGKLYKVIGITQLKVEDSVVRSADV